MQLIRGARRLGGFSGAIVISSVMTFVAFPVLISIVGARAWGAIAVGTSVGSLAAIVLSWGWGISGPTRVAILDRSSQLAMYRRSVSERSALLLPVVIATVGLAVAVSPGFPLLTALSAIGSALSGMSAAWFFVGRGDARGFFIFDTIPRTLIGAVGLAGLIISRDANVYLLAQALGYATAWLISNQKITGHVLPLGVLRLFGKDGMAASAVSFATEATAGIYTFGPPILISLIRPEIVPIYSAIDRVQRLALLATQPFYQVLQGWVPVGRKTERFRERYESGLRFTALASVLVGGALALTLEPVVLLLSGGQIRPPEYVGLLVGASVCLVMLSRYTGLVWLMSVRGGTAVLVSTVIGAVVGLAIVSYGATCYGIVGAVSAVAIAELVVLSFQLVCVVRVKRERYPSWSSA